MESRIALIVFVVLALAVPAGALTCEYTCEYCTGSTISITVQQPASTTTKVFISNCTGSPPNMGCDTSIEYVLSGRSATVTSNCYNHCTISATPVAGKTWAQVTTCADLDVTCLPC